MTTAIEVRNVTKCFQDVQALKGISLTIAEGEFFSLLGPSGCGKTTLLRMIAGFDQPTTGSVIIAGKDVAGIPPHKRPVNMVFQSYALFPHLTVFDNVAFGLKIGKEKISRDEIKRRVTEALELVRLPHVQKRYPRELSGGQQQRIAFARAIVNKPFVLLLDEPLSALDPRIRQEMQAELARFKKELGITFVMVTHDQSEAFALSDHIAVFNAGLIEQVGTPQEIYEQPSSAFVADFIGQTNVWKGIVQESHAGDTFEVQLDSGIRLLGVARGTFQNGDPVVVWIRTDSIFFTEKQGESQNGSNILDAVVVHRSFQGNSTEFILRSGELNLIALVRETGDDKRPGDRVRLSIPAQLTNIMR